jgi:hypothetical protein
MDRKEVSFLTGLKKRQFVWRDRVPNPQLPQNGRGKTGKKVILGEVAREKATLLCIPLTA